jgi:natural product precursor
MKDPTPKPKLNKKLTLHKETIRVLTDKELAEVEGGGGRCTCGNPRSTCPIFYTCNCH